MKTTDEGVQGKAQLNIKTTAMRPYSTIQRKENAGGSEFFSKTNQNMSNL